jgi:hypothetical protein
MDRRTFLLSALAASAIGPSAAEARSHWIRLGSRTLHWRTDRETIRVFLTGPITDLEFRTRTEAVFINTVDVIFNRGSSERHVLNQRILSHSSSRALRVRNRGRDIRRVEFGFRPPGPARPASPAFVELYGRR